jgi:hypothetical protein
MRARYKYTIRNGYFVLTETGWFLILSSSYCRGTGVVKCMP